MQPTYGIGGYGFLLAPAPACRVTVTADRELVLQRAGREVARITPGETDAKGEAIWVSARMAQFGEGGPVLELAEGVELGAVLLKIDTNLPHIEWSALATGMMCELPIG